MANQVANPNPGQSLTVPEESKRAVMPRRSLVEEFPWLPLTLSLEIPVPGLTVQDLLDFRPGSIVKTIYPATSDVPVRANGKLIAWAKFELVGDRLATRITELA